MPRLITITEAARSFADIIGRVYYKGEEFDIKKGNQVVAHIGPSKFRETLKITELNALFDTCPYLSQKDLEDFEKDLKFIQSSIQKTTDKWD